MYYENNKAKDVKVAYVGGGSRGWAWCLMSDLAAQGDMSGNVYLYDIDYEAAQHNEYIGNQYNNCEGANSTWNYYAVKTPQEAFTDADFVIISIQPGTFKEMGSDIHTPEQYGIYQSVGDTSGPGGIVRAMRTVPMFEEIANYIKEYCPNAWVINYTNPMTLCVKTLYRVFPQIKAFGCCHEVYGALNLFVEALKEKGIEVEDREEIKVNPIGVNHFTWLTSAQYRGIDIYPIYKAFCEENAKTGYLKHEDNTWRNGCFISRAHVKIDLFNRYGVIAAAGDRHLAEFCEGKWYLNNPEETFNDWGFKLTPVAWRYEDLEERLEKSRDLRSGKLPIEIVKTGEQGANQMRALLGFIDLVTNVNIPNVGQIPNLPLGAVVETNAIFRTNEVLPVQAGPIPAPIYPLISRVCGEQEEVAAAIADRDLHRIFTAFANDPLVTCTNDEVKKLFKEMVENTKEYLTSYDLSKLDEL